MINFGNTLHFINRVDDANCGDSMVCPLLYYYDYFKHYHIKRHDQRFVDFNSISPNDVVIIGGGGILDYAEFTNRIINRVLDTGAAVIAWSPGTNTHYNQKAVIKTKIAYERFALATIRDFNNPFGVEFLPDVTCNHHGLKKKYTIRRKYGIARHKDYPIRGLDYPFITNDKDVNEILQFIGESEIVISNSFHMIYWAILMGKKTICADPFSTRFYSYQYKPTYYHSDKDDLQECVQRAKTYNVLDECIEANTAFFQRVKAIIESRLTPIADDWDIYRFATREALLLEQLRERHLQEGDLIASQLFVDVGSGFSETCKLIAINNVYGDDLHIVRYDLSGFEEIKALRFDPIESQYCEVEIVTAQTSSGEVTTIAQLAITVENREQFLTTDPQYLILDSCSGFLEIQFRMRVLPLFEAEQLICRYTWMQENRIQEKSARIEDQEDLLRQQLERIEYQDNQLKEQAVRIQTQENLLREQLERMAYQDSQLKEQAVRIQAQEDLLRQQLETIQKIYTSASWKITKPIRAIKKIFGYIQRGRE